MEIDITRSIFADRNKNDSPQDSLRIHEFTVPELEGKKYRAVLHTVLFRLERGTITLDYDWEEFKDDKWEKLPTDVPTQTMGTDHEYVNIKTGVVVLKREAMTDNILNDGYCTSFHHIMRIFAGGLRDKLAPVGDVFFKQHFTKYVLTEDVLKDYV